MQEDDDNQNLVLGILFGIIALVVGLVIGLSVYVTGQNRAPAPVAAVVAEEPEIAEVGEPLVKFYFESGKAVFEVNHGKHHDHLVCVECGKVEEFFDQEIEKRQNAVAEERGFTIQDHALYIYGRCAGCGAKKT